MSLAHTPQTENIEEILKKSENIEDAAKQIEEYFDKCQLGFNVPLHDTMKEIMEGTNK